ncbi:hypothetical protein GGF31_007401 [Allomyces arbusculus]|nr:hypothetical protein GGF31_007401 [Allomyces arbusculus]
MANTGQSRVLPSSLFDTYKQYKQDTDRLVAWLATTVNSLGINVVDNRARAAASSSKKTIRLVSRKTKKKQWQETAPPPTSATPLPSTGSSPPTKGDAGSTNVTLPTSRFTVLAQAIADSFVEVPLQVLTWARRAIRARRQCASWFRDAPSLVDGCADDDDNEDAKHAHFISVLERVVEILEPRCVAASMALKRPSANNAPKPSSSGVTMLTNQFAVLAPFDGVDVDAAPTGDDQEHPDNHDVSADPEPGLVSATNDAPTPPAVQYQAERDALDALFAIHELFVDLEAIRLTLRETWAKYRDGELDLITASLVTNTALDWMRDAETTLVHGRDHICKPNRLISVATYLFSGLRGIMPPKDLFDLDVVLDPARHDVVEYTYVRTYLLLSGIGPKGQPLADSATLYDPTANLDAMTPLQQYSDDMNMLLTVSPLCFLVVKNVPVLQAFSLDVLSSELSKFLDTKRMTMTLIFAAQVLLDIHHDLRGDVVRGEQSLFAVHAQLKRSIEAFRAHPLHSRRGQTPAVDFPSLLDGLLHVCQSLASADIPVSIYRLHPWFCGHVEYVMHEIILNMLVTPKTHLRSLLYAGQLYEACRQFGRDIPGLDTLSWVDMEKFMALYGKEHFFFGRVPDSPKEFVKSNHLMMGLSLTDPIPTRAVKGRRDRRKLALRRDVDLGLKARSFASVQFRDRHVQQWIEPVQLSANLMLRVNQVASDLVSTGTVDVSRLGPTHGNFCGRPLSGIAEMLGMPPGRAFPRSTRIAPVPMLKLVRDLVSSEYELLRFDLLGMHVRCLFVVEAVIAINKDKLCKQFGHHTIDDMVQKTGTPHLVGFLFKDWWFTTEEGAWHYVKPGERPPMSLGMMRDATEFLASWTRVHGREAVAALAELSEIERADGRGSSGQQEKQRLQFEPKSL